MANEKNKNTNNGKNVGPSSDILKNAKNGQSINELLNKRPMGTGYGAKPQTPTTPTQPNSATRNPFANNSFGNLSKPTAPSVLGNKPQTPPATPSTPKPTFPVGGTGSSLLQNLKQTGQTQTQQPSQTPPQTIPTFKTKKELKADLKRREQEKKLQAKFEAGRNKQEGVSGTNAFGKGPKGGLTAENILTSEPTAPTPQGPKNKILSASDFFKQLEDLNKINVDTSADLSGMSDAQYVDEKQQQILEQLEKIQQGKDEKEEKKKRRGGWFWIILLTAILLILVIVGIILYNSFKANDYEYVRISVEMTNPDDLFYDVGVNGERIPVSVNPGDSFDLTIIARNSRNILGDTDAPVWKPIFVRFKVWLAIDGLEQPGFIEIEPESSLWLRYNADIEETFTNDYGLPRVTIDDGYYYLKGMLQPNQQITLIDEITFSLDAITDTVAGKNAELFVQVEVLEDAYGIGTYWLNAPYEWITYLQQNGYAQ